MDVNYTVKGAVQGTTMTWEHEYDGEGAFSFVGFCIGAGFVGFLSQKMRKEKEKTEHEYDTIFSGHI